MSAVLDRFQTLCAHAKSAATTNEDRVSVYDAVAEVSGFLSKYLNDPAERNLLGEIAACAATSSGRLRDAMQCEFAFSELVDRNATGGGR